MLTVKLDIVVVGYLDITYDMLSMIVWIMNWTVVSIYPGCLYTDSSKSQWKVGCVRLQLHFLCWMLWKKVIVKWRSLWQTEEFWRPSLHLQSLLSSIYLTILKIIWNHKLNGHFSINSFVSYSMNTNSSPQKIMNMARTGGLVSSWLYTNASTGSDDSYSGNPQNNDISFGQLIKQIHAWLRYSYMGLQPPFPATPQFFNTAPWIIPLCF